MLPPVRVWNLWMPKPEDPDQERSGARGPALSSASGSAAENSESKRLGPSNTKKKCLLVSEVQIQILRLVWVGYSVRCPGSRFLTILRHGSTCTW